MSRCKACDAIMTESELKRIDYNTGEHLDLCYPKINLNWLLTGCGEMLISESTPHLSTDSIMDLTEYLFDHNETLMTDPLFRKYIESNIITLEIELEKEKLEKMKAEIEERLNAMHSKST